MNTIVSPSTSRPINKFMEQCFALRIRFGKKFELKLLYPFKRYQKYMIKAMQHTFKLFARKV